VGIPGPGGIEWAFALLLWAGFAVLVGELLRSLSARFVPLWRRPEPVERGVLDLYLGGALLYLIASVPWDGFVTTVVALLPVVGATGVVVLAIRALRRPGAARELRTYVAPLLQPVRLLVLLSALGLFVVELSVAVPVATGNTYDSSLLTLYTSLLLSHHGTVLSFSPYASTGLLYPQGTTVWLGGTQLLFGLPPARTPLLVTPLFFGVAPLAGFALGRRLVGTDRAGLAVALLLAWVGTGTRGIVFGSNDFVFAFPLVLLLAGQAVVWWRSPLPRFGDAVGFGLLLGYSAALNPVGAEWLLLALPIVALLTRSRFGGRLRAWFVRWAVALASTLVGIVPSLYVLALGHASPGFVPGASGAVAGSPTGITASQFIGCVDPFLFGSSDTGLSTVAALRLELALLIAVGLAVLLLVGRDSAIGRYLEPFRPFVAGAAVAQVALLAVFWVASTGFGPAVDFTNISSTNELSVWLFTMYGLVAAVPLALALERFTGWLRRTGASAPAGPATTDRPWGNSRPVASRAVVPLVVALVIVVPGVVLTPTALPPTLHQLYQDFGNVTAADFDLLEYAGSHLPGGARVLVAPGSAGQFLPGYCSNIVLLYPMVPGWSTVNSSYERLLKDLPNATLDRADVQALSALAVGWVVVTGNNTMLWPAFSPGPFLSNPTFYPVAFHEGDAYLFQVVL
jgi:hypothetical protein